MPQTYYTAQPDPGESFRCRHVYMDGHRCAAPCLRGQQLCYQHHATRRPIQDAAAHKARLGTFEFPGPDQLADRSGILHAIALVLERIASNDLDPRRAGLLLYGLQTAVIALPKPPLNAEPPLLVEEIAEDPQFGILAPAARIEQLERKGMVQRLVEELERAEQEREERSREEEQQRQLSEPPTPPPAQPLAPNPAPDPAHILPNVQAVAMAGGSAPVLPLAAATGKLLASRHAATKTPPHRRHCISASSPTRRNHARTDAHALSPHSRLAGRAPAAAVVLRRQARHLHRVGPVLRARVGAAAA